MIDRPQKRGLLGVLEQVLDGYTEEELAELAVRIATDHDLSFIISIKWHEKRDTLHCKSFMGYEKAMVPVEKDGKSLAV